MKEKKSMVPKINASPQHKRNKPRKSNMRSFFELRHDLVMSEFFFCRILSAHFWDTNSTIKKTAWQPYFAKYP